MTAGAKSKPNVGQRQRKAKPKPRAGVAERAAKRVVLQPSHSAAGFRRTLEDERAWMDF
jgi:hypothetical protein